jgi:hypothetical protein
MVVVGAAVAEGDTGADTEDNHVGVWEAIIPSPAPERPMTEHRVIASSIWSLCTSTSLVV